jgi:adenylate cyclase
MRARARDEAARGAVVRSALMLNEPQQPLIERLAEAAVPPSDNEDLRLRKSILIIASVATGLATLLWLFIYRLMGLTLPSTIPFVYLVLTVLFLGVYLKTRNFDFYRITQLGLFRHL